MFKKYWFFGLILIAILLSSCTEKRQPSLPEDISFAATINLKDMTVSFVDLKKLALAEEWKMEKPYTGALILPDRDTILFYGNQLETADLYSLKEGKKIGSWETGTGIVNGKLLEDKTEVALVDQDLNKIRFFNIKGKELKQIETESNPLTILESRKAKKLYVLSFNHEKLAVIDLQTKEKTDEFITHPSAAGAWLNEESNELWIGGHGEGIEIEQDIHVYDSETGDLKKTIPAPSMPINFLEKDSHVYVLSHGSNMLYKIKESGELAASVSIAANPFEMAIAEGKLLVAGYDSNDVHILDPQNLKSLKTIKVGEGPFKIVLRERMK
jgi:YVTN family beta-propeller protein